MPISFFFFFGYTFHNVQNRIFQCFVFFSKQGLSINADPPALMSDRKIYAFQFIIGSYHSLAAIFFFFYFIIQYYFIVPGGSGGKESACNVGDPGLIPGSESSPGERNGNQLQYSCLENSVD